MTTKEELEQCTMSIYDDEGGLMRTSKEEMDAFVSAADFAKEVYDVLDKYAIENKIKPKYEGLAEIMKTNEKTIKESVSGKRTITRHFLYKMVVGLKMDIDEAKRIFELSGDGSLSKDRKEDLVCINALRDKDSIDFFINEFNGYFKKHKINTLSEK